MSKKSYLFAFALSALALGLCELLVYLQIAPQVHASNITQAGGGLTVSGFYLVNGTTYYCGEMFAICTPASGLTIVNAGNAILSSAGGTQILSVSPDASPFRGAIAGITIPGTATSLTMAISSLPFTDAATGTPLFGAAFGESVSGKMVSLYQDFASSGAASNYQTAYWSNITTISASLTTPTGMTMGPGSSIWWIRLSCSTPGCQSGNISIQTSISGVVFNNGYTEAVGLHVTPNIWGVLGSSGSTTQQLNIDILSFKVLP